MEEKVYDVHVFDSGPYGNFGSGITSEFYTTIFIPSYAVKEFFPRRKGLKIGGILKCSVGTLERYKDLAVYRIFSCENRNPNINDLERQFNFSEMEVVHAKGRNYIMAKTEFEDVFIPRKSFFPVGEFETLRVGDPIKGVLIEATKRQKEIYERRRFNVAFAHRV